MLLTQEAIFMLRQRLLDITQNAMKYFDDANPERAEEETPSRYIPGGLTWEVTDAKTLQKCEQLRQDIKILGVDIAAAARISPMLSDADMQELRHDIRQMLANLRFRLYRHSGVEVHHDEGYVLGVDPPTHEETPFDDASTASRHFHQTAQKVVDIIDLLMPTDTDRSLQQITTSNYQPNTAFVMMAIDETKPELEDTRMAIIDVFKSYGIKAKTAQEIDLGEKITDLILCEIETSEFLIADLTYERPNVYYEIGHAHALNKRVILVCKKGTKVHFDVAHRNYLTYENITRLKSLLGKRLEMITNKKNPSRG